MLKKEKETYEQTKISPLIFAVLLIIILLMFAIGKQIDKKKPIEDSPKITTTTTAPIPSADENSEEPKEENQEIVE